MEFFIFRLDGAEGICGNWEDPDEVCEWKGITCNAERVVEEFWWSYKFGN